MLAHVAGQGSVGHRIHGRKLNDNERRDPAGEGEHAPARYERAETPPAPQLVHASAARHSQGSQQHDRYDSRQGLTSLSVTQ